jgi:thiazole synthase
MDGRNGDPLLIAGKEFRSRLIMGTGKFPDMETMNRAYEAAGAEMVTVALRRLDLDNPNEKTLLDYIDWSRYSILPNTAGARTAEEAVHTARLARAMGLSDWIKLEVIPDLKYLQPDPIGTLEAAKSLVKEGFVVLPYINADPILARQLEDAGCATVMPLASPLGSGHGMVLYRPISIIIEQANVPVVVDAGIGAPSDATLAMEIGADACLINTAIARAKDPVRMARAMAMGVACGREAYLAGRVQKLPYASASSPLEGVVGRS